MKILLVAPFGGVPGGISRWTGHIVDYYNKYGYNDCHLTVVPMGRSMFVNGSMSVFKRLWYAWIDYRSIFNKLRHELSNNEFDVMHLTSSGSLSLFKDIAMLKMARRKGLKCLVHFRFGRIPELSIQRNWEWKLINKVIKLSHKVVVIDRATYDTLISAGYKNIVQLDNPVAPQVLETVASNQDLPRIKNQILFTGHVVKTKGVLELLEACSSIDNILLKLVGHITPNMLSEIQSIYGSDTSWLEICGELPYNDVIKEMLMCDIFVLPTYTEGFPNVILESMAAGCAIISTPVGAIPQMLNEDECGKYGVLVEAQNAQQLHNAIINTLGNEKLKSELRNNVKRRVNERYNMKIIWNKLLTIWESCTQ